MNANPKIIRFGLLLFASTMALFFLLLFVFSMTGSMTEAQYFNYSALICCFGLPVLYGGVAFYSVFSTAKVRPLGMKQAWLLSFVPMFMGGLLSNASIFIFFNTSGKWAADSLQRGWFNLITANPDPEFLEESQELLSTMADLSINLFSLRNFFLSFSFIIFFYFLISFIFAVFFKNKTF